MIKVDVGWKKKWVAIHGTELMQMTDKPSYQNIQNMKMKKLNITADSKFIDEKPGANEDEGHDHHGFSVKEGEEAFHVTK